MKEQIYKTFIKDDNGDISYQDYEPEFIITGDTDSAYIDLSTLFDESTDKEKVIKFSDKLSDTVNKAFPQFLKDVFNVSDDNVSVIQTEREIVSDKSLFTAKKKYIMHVVDKEGIPQDDYKIMGLEIKKTSTPFIIQKMLKEIVILLMDGGSFDEVSTYIKKFKEDYHKASMLDIGTPTNIKNLSKYEKRYIEQKSMNKFPWHVRASMFYNSLCTSSDVTIKDGSKIKVVYIINPDMKYIAIPSDANQLPKFLNDMVIDWKTSWAKVENTLELYLKPIGYDYASRKKKHIERFIKF